MTDTAPSVASAPWVDYALAMRARICIGSFALLLAACPASDSGIDGDSWCETCDLETQSAQFEGEDAQNCGRVVPSADAAAVNACLVAAAGSGNAFGVYEIQGTDSLGVVKWIVDETGTVTRVSFDSDICGGAGECDEQCGPRVSVTDCGPAIASPDGSSWPFECASTESTPLCEPPN